MRRYYNIAGVNICISGKDDEMYTDERKLKTFCSEKKKDSYHYVFSMEEELDEEKGFCIHKDGAKQIFQDRDVRIQYIGVVRESLKGAYIRCESQGRETKVQVKRSQLPARITSKVVLNAIGIESIAKKARGFILHSSFINVNGKAILFTAPSGTGKSTQADLWKELRGADIINGDRAIVRIQGNQIDACGLPFAGSSEYCKNAILPLAAVVYLEQFETTKIQPLQGAQAFRKIWEQITVPVWDKEAVEQISEKLLELLNRIPVYHLACTPDESAVIALENELNKLEKNGKED